MASADSGTRDARRRRWSNPHFRLGDVTSVRISPGWFIPSSTTAICGLERAAGARGRPIWLFRFPLFLKTGSPPPGIPATTSLVVVLPALPVIATTVAPGGERHGRDPAARVVSSTWMTSAGVAVPASGDTGAWWTIAPMAPRRAASPTNRCPSKFHRRSPRRSRPARASASQSTRGRLRSRGRPGPPVHGSRWPRHLRSRAATPLVSTPGCRRGAVPAQFSRLRRRRTAAPARRSPGKHRALAGHQNQSLPAAPHAPRSIASFRSTIAMQRVSSP